MGKDDSEAVVNTRDVLRKAADLLESVGWCQGTDARHEDGTRCDHMFDDGAAAYCAVGAIEHVVGHCDYEKWERTVESAKRRLLTFIEDRESARYRDDLFVSVWNDTIGMTAEEVVGTMREGGGVKEKRILLEAADLLENVGWCQEADARDSRGIPTYIWNPDAAAYCASGAVQKICRVVSHNPDFEKDRDVVMALDRLLGFLPGNEDFAGDGPVSTSVGVWNDAKGRTVEEIVNTMRRAAA